MTPQERMEFNQMKQQLQAIAGVLDVPFIESVKRRCVEPLLLDPTDFIIYDSDTTLSGLTRSVAEGGSGSYTVADVYDDAKIVTIDGVNYKIGVYNA